jgi:hypothetical protein
LDGHKKEILYPQIQGVTLLLSRSETRSEEENRNFDLFQWVEAKKKVKVLTHRLKLHSLKKTADSLKKTVTL